MAITKLRAEEFYANNSPGIFIVPDERGYAVTATVAGTGTDYLEFTKDIESAQSDAERIQKHEYPDLIIFEVI